jgi:hypothetical protein
LGLYGNLIGRIKDSSFKNYFALIGLKAYLKSDVGQG